MKKVINEENLDPVENDLFTLIIYPPNNKQENYITNKK